MTEEKKTEEKKTEAEEFPRGDRGFVGEATTAQLIKKLWHETCFKRADAGDRFNPRKKMWVPLRDAPSLKEFARSLLKDPTHGKLAKDWLDHKKGSLNEERSDKNKSRIVLEKQATKAAKRKKSSKGGKSSTEAAPAAK